MLAELRQDRSALHWIRGELDQTLREARATLEDYVEGDAGRLSACIDLLHHVHGALEMVQVYGGAMLADEMEQLARALAGDEVKRKDAAAEALMSGMVQLPAYLEKLEGGGADIPLVLLPLMNDLRSTRDAPLVSETSLFAPKLQAVVAAETVRPGSGSRQLPHLIHQRRSQYHRALLNWIRGQEVEASLQLIGHVLEGLKDAAGTARLRRLLDAATALVHAVMDDPDGPPLAVQPLFGKIDRVFKQIIDQGEESAMLDFPTELLKNLLYYVSRSSSSDPAVLSVKHAADLVNSFADQASEGVTVGSLGAPDRELFNAVGEALAQDLRDVKDHLDLFMRSDRSDVERVTGLVPPIQRIADTLGMVGRGELRGRLKHRCEELQSASASGTSPAEDRLMALAEDLLFVESSLVSLGERDTAEGADEAPGGTNRALSGGELQQHLRAAIDEALVELAKTKDSILEYLKRPEQAEILNEIPPRLHVVAGVLQMLELPEAGRLLSDLEPYVAALATGEKGVPDAQERDALADVVISAELYMQSAVEPGGDREKLLKFAEAALQRLGLRESNVKTLPLGDASFSAFAGADLSALKEIPPGQDVAAVDSDETVVSVGAASGGCSANLEAESEQPVEAEDREQATASVEPEPAGGSVPPVADEVDSEILEIFGEEAREELEVIESCYPKWRESQDDRDSLLTMRRSFHTLKGSGRIVGASNLGEFSWAVENLLNRVIDGTVPASADLLQLMDEAVAVLPALVEESTGSQQSGTDVSALAQRAFALAAGEKVEASGETVAERDGAEAVTTDEETAVQVEDAGQPSIDEPSSEIVELLAGGAEQQVAAWEVPYTAAGQDAGDESILTAMDAQDSDFTEFEAGASGVADSSLNAVFSSEAEGHLAVLGDFVQACRRELDGCDFDDGLRRAMHTLHGSARTAGAEALAQLAGALESFINAAVGHGSKATGSTVELLERSHHAMLVLAAGVEDDGREVPQWENLREEIDALTDRLLHPTSAAPAAAMAESVNERIDPELLEVFLDEARELLEALETELGVWEHSTDDHRPVAQLQRTLHTMKGGARLAGVATVGDLSHALESVFESVVERRVDDSVQLKALVRHATDVLAQDIDKLVRDQMPVAHDDMVERLEAAAHGRDWTDLAPLAGSAESAPVETEPAAMERDQHAVAPQPDAWADTTGPEDLGEDSELLADSQLMTDSELLRDSSLLEEEGAVQDQGQGGADPAKESTVIQFPAAGQLADEEQGFVAQRPLPEELPPPAAGSERVRVASEALDQMVNNAGEVSIYRARIEQQNSSTEFNLAELGRTIDRLRGQLRKLELETEAQILSRHEREGDDLADFDPLEMDRYSTIQQLSRALSETVEDLSNLGHTLSDLSRDTDTLLLQQARVTTDLQDSLLRTRMVKFSSRVPRLERVVRQTSHSVGKQAALEVTGGGEDMDRAILERMMGPLEHLLRNAVSHGIEDAETRAAKGKAPQGLIRLALAREGTNVVLTLSDDGAGLDGKRIRAKAIERGLIAADASIDDQELYQLILQPGFSTAQELSQVSGRGVGMDVVLTEVKQLGGSLDIDSRPGEGATFTIRLPFTLAITDALLVTMGEDIFAVPHSSTDGVVRIPVDELRAVYAGEQDGFEYAGRKYAVRYLGSMLGALAPHIAEGARWLPLLLVHSGDHHVAIHVDGLLGNRQIVVKSIGAQLSGVRWFTGGTILADGQIALILDTNSLVRMDSVQQTSAPTESAEPVSKGVMVMVVDDSITVRKVTSRLLERHNMQVVTAKDGVDAVTLLQEHRPDVMLLDIEMPRMDGYELARHMRSTPELSDIPIIMITSRTGDKHRNRAVELGVKRYLGKPYQEAELLENIYTLLADKTL